MEKIYTTILMLILNVGFVHDVYAEKSGEFAELMILKQILERDENQLDLAKTKLTIDKLIDPSIDIEKELNRINQMVAGIQSMIPSDANSMEIMLAIKKYIYKSGAWNADQIYHYDFDDPLGTKIANKLLPNYLTNKSRVAATS